MMQAAIITVFVLIIASAIEAYRGKLSQAILLLCAAGVIRTLMWATVVM